jgi:hypothetical protein
VRSNPFTSQESVTILGTCEKTSQPKKGDPETYLSSKIADLLCTGADCSANDLKIVKQFVALINPDGYNSASQVGKTNKGVRDYFKSIVSNKSCFAALGARFYGEESLHYLGRRKLGAESQNGAAWKLAKKYAMGDENLAMALLGACGHDDLAESSRELELRYCVSDQPDDLKLLLNSGANRCIDSSWREVSLPFDCPISGQTFYLPGGLEGVELSSDFKSKLAAGYASDISPGKEGAADGSKAIPHKYYHVYGAGYFTCSLIQNGLPPKKATEIVKENALLYRAVRVCERTSKNLSNYNDLLKYIGEKPLDFSKNPKDFSEQWNRASAKVSTFLREQVHKGNYDVLSSYGINGNWVRSNEDKAILLEKFNRYPGIVLAGYLTGMQKEPYSDEKILSLLKLNYGENAPILNKMLSGLRDSTSSLKLLGNLGGMIGINKAKELKELAPCIQNSLLNYSIGHQYHCEGFSDCSTAQAKLKTYATDFLQTAEYHKMGADFAAKHCSRLENADEVFGARSCDALQKLKAEQATKTVNPDKPPSGTGRVE